MTPNSATSMKKKKFKHIRWKKDRSCLLLERDARAMERLLTFKEVKIPKQAASAIDKPVSEWTARRALCKIGLISAIKHNSVVRKKCVGSSLILQGTQKLEWKRHKLIAFSPMVRNTTGTVLKKV